MLWKRRRERHSGNDIEHVECHVRVLQQEFQRRVRHQVAGSHDGEQPDGGGISPGLQLIQLLSLQRLLLHREPGVRRLLQLQHDAQVHQGVGVMRIGLRALEQPLPQWRQIDSFEGHGHERRETD